MGALLVGLSLMTACESADCTLENNVSLRCGFYSNGKTVALTDTLTVTAAGTDSILLNKSLKTSNLQLPMSFWNPCDTFVLTVKDTLNTWRDTIWVEKTNRPHFESPDCPSTMFHDITSVRSTHVFIDSLKLMGTVVDFRKYEQIQIHLGGTK